MTTGAEPDAAAATGTGFAVVVPTIGRPSLQLTLAGLLGQDPAPAHVVVVDDRPAPSGPAAQLDPLELGPAAAPHALPHGLELTVVRSGGRGPAAARNAGWRATRADRTAWVVTLDDDVLVPEGWSSALLHDLHAHPDAAGITGRIVVPQPTDRRPTDWERCTTGLQDAWWATADMAFRRDALDQAGGFDERFPRAYREDADLAIRLQSLGRVLARGDRHVVHPVRPAPRWISVRTQRGNADDALMRAVHGPRWRELGHCHRGRLPWHAATVAAAALAVAGPGRRTRTAAAAAWLALTTDFARRRIAPGPRDRDEVLTMLATSVAIPPAALWWRARGAWRWRTGATPWHLLPHAAPQSGPQSARQYEPGGAVRAVLFDRDGTLVHDVPYNGDPAKVRPVAGARDALDRLRAAGLRIGLVSNQSGVARGLIGPDDVTAVNARLQELLGPLDTVQVCPHGEADGCGCRKPEPGMVLAAAAELGVPTGEVVVVGDIGADVGAAAAAGARSVLVPTPVTRHEEVRAAPVVAADLHEAVDWILAAHADGLARTGARR